jgi:hypothetical protein
VNTLPCRMHLVNDEGRSHGRGSTVAASAQTLVQVLAAHMAATRLTATDSDRLFFKAPRGGLLSYPELAQPGVALCG